MSAAGRKNYYTDIPEDDGNNSIKEQRQKTVESYIIDINNKLVELINFMHLDLPEIKPINKGKYGKIKNFDDDSKKNIIDVIKMEESIKELERNSEKRKRDAIKQAMVAAGINGTENSNFSTPSLDEIKESEIDEFKKRLINKSTKLESLEETSGLTPPKTEWKRVGISKDEKEKILESIRANPNSNVFSKEFKWDILDYINTFKFLEEANGYKGPFLSSIVSDRFELEKYSKHEKLSQKIPNILFGKFVLLSMYDITASSKESKYIYIGLNYNSSLGELEFECMGSIEGLNIENAQRKIAMEYMDAMGIKYKSLHEDLILK